MQTDQFLFYLQLCQGSYDCINHPSLSLRFTRAAILLKQNLWFFCASPQVPDITTHEHVQSNFPFLALKHHRSFCTWLSFFSAQYENIWLIFLSLALKHYRSFFIRLLFLLFSISSPWNSLNWILRWRPYEGVSNNICHWRQPQKLSPQGTLENGIQDLENNFKERRSA